ncbi:MAG: MucR family transcriptional regulator [Syntrophobacter sp.]
MSKKLTEIASEIVQSQVSLTPMSAVEIATSLREVFRTLQVMQRSESDGSDLAHNQDGTQVQEDAAPKMTPEDSIQNDKVICLECGKEMRQLTARHLVSHGLSPREYRQKYGFTMRTPLSAKSLTKARIKIAKKRGLPENLAKYIEARRQNKTEPVPSQAPAMEDASINDGGDARQTKLRKKAKTA